MKKLLATFAALAALLIPTLATHADNASTGPRVPALQGRLVLKSMPLSKIVGRKITTWIYLPPGYDNGATRYPVIYLLHGQPGGWTDCYRSGRLEEMADSLITAGKMPPVILVAFDGNGPGGANDLTNFCNRVSDGYRAEDMITQELVPYVDNTYRTIPTPAMRALWGYSAGGFGALNLGFKHPDIWHVLCSHAGFYSPDDDAVLMTHILGPRGAQWDSNNPMVQIRRLEKNTRLHVFMDASPKEDGFDEFQTLTKELQARGDDCQTKSLPKAHAWRLIVTRCSESLQFAGRAFASESGAAKSTP